MKRVIRATTDVEQYEDFLFDGQVYTGSQIRSGYRKFQNMMSQLEAEGFDMENGDLGTEIWDRVSEAEAWDAMAGATCQVICDAIGRRIGTVSQYRESPDADFCCVTFKDGTNKYFFDRGIFTQGIKDAETGELYGFGGYSW